MYLSSQRTDMCLIYRSKTNGFGQHWGVLLPDGRVADYQSVEGLRICNIEKFSAGLDVHIEKAVPLSEWSGVFSRLDGLRQAPPDYHLIDWNCETFARWLVGEPPRSEQINDLAILATIGIAVKVLSAA